MAWCLMATITWMSVDWSTVKSSDIHLRVIPWEVHQPSIINISLKITSVLHSLIRKRNFVFLVSQKKFSNSRVNLTGEIHRTVAAKNTNFHKLFSSWKSHLFKNLCKVQCLYSTIPYNTRFYITQSTHEPQIHRCQNRTLKVFLNYLINGL